MMDVSTWVSRRKCSCIIYMDLANGYGYLRPGFSKAPSGDRVEDLGIRVDSSGSAS